MGIFSRNESGTGFHRSRYTRSISNRMDYDCQFHQLIPVLKRFALSGDIWRIGGEVLVRFHPMLSPTLTPNNFRVRYFFVPLRLVEPNTELIITGSDEGHLHSGTLPVFDNFVTNADKVHNPNAYKVVKHSFWDYMNVPVGDYESIKNDECLPANYWMLGYERILWDYYVDENISNVRMSYATWDLFRADKIKDGCNIGIGYSCLSKDYFTSALPWQLKGVAPRINVTGSARLTPNFNTPWVNYDAFGTPDSQNTMYSGMTVGNVDYPLTVYKNSTQADFVNGAIYDRLNTPQTNVSITGLGFDVDDMRTVVAETRIFERAARCGTRYTEFLYANFGIAPADETLQRAQYLGGWKVPIITTEVLQTAEDGSNPVGTMRGHGITRGGQRIKTFVVKEPGMIFGIAEVRPEVQYTQGIAKQLTYKRRFDFFNPSFQHLSEQEVRNGELFISFTDGKNDETFGFQAYGNDLRSYQNETVGDLRDNLAYWNQALNFSSRPNLNTAFIGGYAHLASFNRPFVVNGASAYPIIVQFYNKLDVYRPMVKYSTPGLVDHM